MRRIDCTKERLQELLATNTAKAAAAILGCTQTTVYNTAQRYGLRCRVRYEQQRICAKARDEQLRELLKTHSLKKAAKIMGCSFSNTQRRAARLGIQSDYQRKTDWTEEKVNRLRELLKTHSVKDVAQMFGYSVSGFFQQIMSRFGLRSEYRREIKKEKDAQLRELLAANSTTSRAQLAKIMGSSIYTVGLGKKRLGLTKPVFSDKERAALRQLRGKYTLKEIAEIMEYSLGSTYYHLNSLPECQLWRKLHGTIPQEKYVDFIDGNTNNLTPENLTLRVNHRYVACIMSPSGNVSENHFQFVEAYVQQPELIEAQLALYEAQRTMRALEHKKRKKAA